MNMRFPRFIHDAQPEPNSCHDSITGVIIGNVVLTRLLCEKGAKMDGKVNGRSLLHMALDSNIEMLKTLLEFRTSIDIDSLDDGGLTPLHSAVTRPVNVSYAHVQALIRAGAEINERNSLDPTGESILHAAA